MKVFNFIFSVLAVLSLLLSTANAQQKSDRERHGLSDAVKTIISKYVFVNQETKKESDFYGIQAIEYDRTGKIIKKPPISECHFCGTAEIKRNAAGKIIEDAYYGKRLSKKLLILKIVYTRNFDGKLTTADYYNDSGKHYRKWKYMYEYDSHKNWIRRIASMCAPNFSDEKAECIPREVYYRTITYY